MSTRSNIAIRYKNGTIKAIYCHFDGYLSGVGSMLLDNWKNPKKVATLVSDVGNISALKSDLKETRESAYGESATEYKDLATYLDSVDTFFIEYVYVFDEAYGAWFYATTYDSFETKKPLSNCTLEPLTWKEIEEDE